MLSRLFALFCGIPRLRKFLWKKWYDFLAGFSLKREWRFMNYGYEETAGRERLGLSPEDEEDRYCIQLYQHLLEGMDLTGKHVLEIGSGRGGGISYIQRCFKPVRTVGLDYSDKAVGLCSRRYQIPGLVFRQGDAESLPFEDREMDIILNVESSHCYGDVPRFFQEVHRVLRPGGFFLYADFRDGGKVEAWTRTLKDSGLTILGQTDITSNVLAALDADHERKLRLIRESIPGFLVKPFLDFAGMKGARVYEFFRKREMLYFSFVASKAPYSHLKQ